MAPHLSSAYADTSRSLPGTRLAGQQGDVSRLPVRLERGKGQTQTNKDPVTTDQPCPVWQLISPIGLLTATDKQVYLG